MEEEYRAQVTISAVYDSVAYSSNPLRGHANQPGLNC
jgi:hypothetical protein